MSLSVKTDKPLLLGITGGIGSGKSVVSHILSVMGYPVYDSDSFAKWLMNVSDEIRVPLMERFGDDLYVDGVLNRPFLAERIFGDRDNLLFVNSVVHPAVARHFLSWSAQQNSERVFIESAILFSSGLDKIVDYVVFVDAPADVRLARVMSRDNAQRESIEARMFNQRSDVDYARAHSRFCIVNDNQTLLLPQVLGMLR